MLFAGQLSDTQQELKENNELVVELQGNLFWAAFVIFPANSHTYMYYMWYKVVIFG